MVPAVSPRKKSRRTRKCKGAQPRQSPPSGELEKDWSRTGAHNVAGVTFQVAVTAGLLVEAGSFESPLTRVTPEGFEDIDVEFSDETRALVQVKERSPPGRFGRSNFVEALRAKKHVLTEDPQCRFVLATNATLGGGLTPTGWDRSLSGCLAQSDLDTLAQQLTDAFDDPYEILSRCHVVQIGWDVVERNRADLAYILNIHPSVAALAYSRLLERITGVTVRQRSATPGTAEWIAVSDLDALGKRVLESVDVGSLDEAVGLGIIEPVDFSVRANLKIEEFLAGVDVLPAHIAADLDLPRPTEVGALTEALGKHHSALLVGPSGAGKSALLWRVARELAGRVRPYRLLRLLPEDVPRLSRWIRLQEPSANCALLICADNLGRRDNEGWTTLATEFVDSPGVLLVGACREEDHRPGLAVGRTTIVDPKLDRELAESIAEALAERKVPTTLDVSEAFDASEGLLMEFISLLMTGRRLKQVIEQQVRDRLKEDRATERDILRCVATAHSVGIGVPAEVLGTLIPDRDLTLALAMLDQEHILVADDGNHWRGLHELRSTVARDYLHQFPPPTMAATIRRLVEHLPISGAGRIIELYARSEVDLTPAAEAVSGILGSGQVNVEDGAILVRALGMADAYRHARMCLRVIEENRPSRLDPETALNLAYAHRFAGVSFDSLKNLNPGFARVVQLADLLPDRPPSLREIGLQGLSSDEVLEIAFRGTPDQAVAWLESLEGTGAAKTISGHDITAHFAGAPLRVVASLSATVRALSGAEGAGEDHDVFGDFDHRMGRLAIELPDCVEVASQEGSDGRVVTVTLLPPGEDSTLHERSVETCRLIFDLLPEADIAETIVITPDGDRLAVENHEEGHKKIPRENLPRRRQTADNVNFLRAGRLLLSSRYWTEPVRVLADASAHLLGLWNDAVSWLMNPHHNRRRRQDAVERLDSLIAELAAGPKVPVDDDDSGDRNNAMGAMSQAVSVIRDLAAAGSPDARDSRNLGVRCRDAVARFTEARQGNLPSLSTVGEPLPEALDEMLSLLAELLIASAEQRSIPLDLSGRTGSESWVDVACRCMDAVASVGYQAEREALEDALATSISACEIHRIEHPDMKSGQFLMDWWVVVVSLEGDLPDLTGLSDRLDSEMAQQLASRTFVVFGEAGGVLPAYALKLGVCTWWPASVDDLLKIASGLRTEVVNTTQLQAWDAFVNELVGASHAASLFRLRQQAGLVGDKEAFDSRFASARSAAEVCHPSLQGEAFRLLCRVENGPYSQGQSFAGEVYRVATHAEQSDDIMALMECRGHALSLDLEGGDSADQVCGHAPQS